MGLLLIAVAAAPATARPLKVFVLAGQSNMQGHAQVRTMDAMALDPATAAVLADMVDADGAPRVCDRVWISSVGSSPEERTGPLTAGFGADARGPKIGPEFSFGIFAEQQLDEPILIIKTAWGGKSLHTDFRPPGAGPAESSAAERTRLEREDGDPAAAAAERAAASGRFYRAMIEHVQMVLADIERVVPGHDPADGYELAGFVWFQGWNDMVDGNAYPDRGREGGYDAYSELLTQFIRDVRRDLAAPGLPFVIGVMGVGGPVDDYGPEQQRYRDIHRRFREAMAAPAERPEFAGTVTAVRTAPYWDAEVTALRRRESELKPQVDAIRARIDTGVLTQSAGAAAIAALEADAFTPRELTLLRESTSNAEYHYLGSARILAPIGKAFADAMVAMIRERDSRPDAREDRP
jgi:alpha-galactosidase